MEAPNFAIGHILSWIRHWMKRPVVASYSALPADMLHEILLRLPADEVCRLRLVCQTWRSLTFDPHFAWAHASIHPQPHVIVVCHNDDDEAAEVRDVDLHGCVIKSMQIRKPIVGPLSLHGDLLCASHGWKLTSVVDIVTGAVAAVGVDPRKKVNSAAPYCVLGHVPATGEYKVLRIQHDYCNRQRRQMCEVLTLGVGSDTNAGSWRRRTCPRVTLSWTLDSCHVVAVAGLVYFLDCYGTEDDRRYLEADRMAVFDLATEEWKPKTIQGPITSSMLAGERDDEDPLPLTSLHFGASNSERVGLLLRCYFQLAKLDESLVVVYCNFKKSFTELWFMEDKVDATTPRWSKRYTLQNTPFRKKFSPQFHYPLAVLDDGRILAWVERTSALKAYDPETCTWTDLATLTGACVVGMHHGSLLCSNLGVAQP